METITPLKYNPNIYIIILKEDSRKKKYFVLKESIVKNERKIPEEEYSILRVILNTGYLETYNTETYNEKGKLTIKQAYRYQVLKNSAQHSYLKKEYKDILEDTYLVQLTYYRNKETVEEITFSDNNGLRNIGIVDEQAKDIIGTVIRTNQDLTIRWVGNKEDPEEAEKTVTIYLIYY